MGHTLKCTPPLSVIIPSFEKSPATGAEVLRRLRFFIMTAGYDAVSFVILSQSKGDTNIPLLFQRANTGEVGFCFGVSPSIAVGAGGFPLETSAIIVEYQWRWTQFPLGVARPVRN